MNSKTNQTTIYLVRTEDGKAIWGPGDRARAEAARASLTSLRSERLVIQPVTSEEVFAEIHSSLRAKRAK